jgi:hypothetical protein
MSFNQSVSRGNAEKTAGQLLNYIGQGGYTANDAFLNATTFLEPKDFNRFLQTQEAKDLLSYDLYNQDPERAKRLVEDTALTTFGATSLPQGMVERYTQAARDAGRTGSPSDMRQFIAQSLAANSAFSEPRTVNDYDRQVAARMGNIMFNPDGIKSGRYDVGERIADAATRRMDIDAKRDEDRLAGKYGAFV